MLNYPLGGALVVQSTQVSKSTYYDILQLDNESSTRDVVVSKDSVMVILVREDGKIGIIYRRRPPLFPCGGAEFPAWKLDEIDEKNLSISADSREVANVVLTSKEVLIAKYAATRKVEEKMGLSTKKFFFVDCDYLHPHIGTERTFPFILKVENSQKTLQKLGNDDKDIFGYDWFDWEEIVFRTRRQQRSRGRIHFVENEKIPMVGVSLQVVNKLIAMEYDPRKVLFLTD